MEGIHYVANTTTEERIQENSPKKNPKSKSKKNPKQIYTTKKNTYLFFSNFSKNKIPKNTNKKKQPNQKKTFKKHKKTHPKKYHTRKPRIHWSHVRFKQKNKKSR